MKKFIGRVMMTIGGFMWQHGGWNNGEERYEDLRVTGKLGYQMLCKGMKMVGITMEDLEKVADGYVAKIEA